MREKYQSTRISILFNQCHLICCTLSRELLMFRKNAEMNKDGEQNSIILLILHIPVTICVLKTDSTDTWKCLNITGGAEQELYINKD